MAALEIQGNGDSGVLVTDEQIAKTIEGLENAQQKNFISKCLQLQPEDRASARELLFHPLLFEVHSLKLLAAHCLVNTAREYQNQGCRYFSTKRCRTSRYAGYRSKEPRDT